MSLKSFHTFFIIISFLLSAYFGGWCVSQYSDTTQISMLVMAVGSFVAATGLALYLIWFLRKLKAVSFLSLALLGFCQPQVASACAVCMGNPNSPMTKSVNEGVWFLLCVIGVVLVAFASLFLYWRHRAKQISLI